MAVTLFKIESENESLFLLKSPDTLISGCLIQYHSDVLYIEALDSTGLIQPRDLQKDLIYSLIYHICKLEFSLITVFSQPCKENLFGKSKLNSLKGYLGPKKLQDFWKSYFISFNLGDISVYSNFNSQNTFPYQNFDQIRMFEDDPKRKCKIVEEIDIFYQSLLHRADFIKGALVYLKKSELKGKCINVEFDSDSIVRRAVDLLRNSDFSGFEPAILSTKTFFEKFYCEKIDFEIRKAPEKVKDVVEKIVFLKPNKKI